VGIPAGAARTAAVIAAVPCGWALGVIAAQLICGPDVGALPAATIPFGIAAALWFALWPRLGAWMRLVVLVIGAGLFLLLD
jgi:hypothetical protein